MQKTAHSVIIPKGFSLATASAGFKAAGRQDVALAVSEAPATVAALFTTNLFQAAPVQVGQKRVREKALARAVLVNAGNANACTGEEGITNCIATTELVAAATGLSANDILPASTGVIGVQFPMKLWEGVAPDLAKGLGKAGPEDFARAIMTSDAFPKLAGEQISLGGGVVTVAGFAKGAGMICPNMATMISVVLCDAAVAEEDWHALFERAVGATFNRATVDGDTSTNDTVYALANGASNIVAKGDDLTLLEAAVTRILASLAYMLVQDGEGATKVMHITVKGAKTNGEAELAARAVGHSQLVKTAMYGKDANWGRIVAALGRCGVPFAPEDVRVSLCGVELFKDGRPSSLDFDALLKEPLEQQDLPLDISLGDGPGHYTLLASDLTHEYVNINASYRS
ncbi:bifunctional glutamate N-acetyltransferase/amino-acid acetyltransferase ArgJ [Desulfovibrio sp. OttesenSCG-928-G15]|nr:bifunctional glutamate N-acetyltransferase/amino-acid acetyltransferase ArgJ [Desulfovibrio sp. OttesenSCG-928-G15]